jgi:hypothetical protein
MASLTTNVLQNGTEADRRHAVEEALASVRIEGLEPPPEFHELASRFVAGELGIDELLHFAEDQARTFPARG